MGDTPQTNGKYDALLLPATNTLPAAFFVQDPNTKLGTNRPWTNFPADPTVSVATLLVPRIEVLWETKSGNTALDANTNTGRGIRIYPDATSPTDVVSGRNQVRVRVKTTPAVTNYPVRLRWLDVDDPTSEGSDMRFVIDANDGVNAPRGNDNRGGGAGVGQTILTLDNTGQAVTDFDVSWQPGDNFRIAAILNTPGADTHINQLQVTDSNGPLYVTADTNQLAEFVGALSPMLTVWRKLHLEFDSMAAPPTSGNETIFASGFIVGAKINYPVPGQSQIRVNHLDITGPGKRLFENGFVQVVGGGRYKVLGSSTDNGHGVGYAFTTVQIEGGTSTGLLLGSTVTLWDDDDRFLQNDSLYPSLLNLPSPFPVSASHLNQIVPLLKSAYRPAYIEVIDANAAGWNTTLTVPFRRSQSALQLNVLGQQVSYFDQGNLQLKGTDRFEFWAHSVIFGYQSEWHEDAENDDESALEGGTPKRRGIDGNWRQALGYSVVFMESIRDRAFLRWLPSAFTNSNSTQLRLDYWSRLAGQTAHEVGHAPGRQGESDDHSEEGLMKGGGEVHPGPNALASQKFKPASIKRLRGIPSWNN